LYLHIRIRPSREQEKKKDGFSLIFKNVNECSSGERVERAMKEWVGGRGGGWRNVNREEEEVGEGDGTNLVIQSMKQGQ
jgi:hypothetical protein